MKRKPLLVKNLLVVSTILFGLSLTTRIITYANEDTITSALNQSNTEVIQGEEDPNLDKEYGFRSEFDNLQDLVRNGFKVQEEEEAEGCVLLKNDNNALPLAKGSKVSLFGVTGALPFYGASGSGGINTKEAIGWYDAFRGINHEGKDPKAINQGEKIFDLNEKLANDYATWSKDKAYAPASSITNVNIGDVPWATVEQSEGFKDVATYGDAAIYVIKRTGGEGYDLPATSGTFSQYGNENYAKPSINDGVNGDYLQLSETEKSVLEGLKTLKKEGKVKKIVLLLNMASTIQLDFLTNDTYDIDACLWTGAVGEVGTIAVAKLLSGEYVPSAKASSTLWQSHLMNPVNNNFCDQNYFFTYENYKDFGFTNPAESDSYQSTMTTYMVYQEGMYLGYKYTETRYEDYVLGKEKVGDYKYKDVVAYPFGHGLSYTDFEFGKPVVTKDGDKYNVTVEVKNTGPVAGKTPVQIYIAKPYEEYAKTHNIQVPSVELIEFGKTGVINPGNTETITISVDERFFTSYDTEGAGTYAILEGDYYLIVANDAHEATNNLLAAKGYNPQNTAGRMDHEGNKDMTYKVSLSFNDKKYSTSRKTNNPITNAFDFADINKYERKGSNSVSYYTREDWSLAKTLSRTSDGKLIKNNAKLVMTEQMKKDLLGQIDTASVIKKGGEYPKYGANNGLTLLSLKDLSYDNPRWEELLDQLTWDETVDLLSNGRHKTQAIQSVQKPSTGDENGPNGFNVTYKTKSGGSKWTGPTNPYAERLLGEEGLKANEGYTTTGFSSNGVLAASFNKELAAKVGKQIGEEGYWGGQAGWLGGGFNILRSPYAGRTSEYYSEDAMLTGLIGAPETKAVESMGVHCFVKHCALNESETGRHGSQERIQEQAFRENYLRAFELAFIEGGAFNVMTAFNRLGTVAVANSTVFTQRFLRNEVGLPGIVETDCAGDMTDGKHGEAYVSRIINVYTGASDLNEYNYGANEPDYAGSTYTFASFAPDASGKGDYGDVGQAMRRSAKRILYSTLTSNAVCGYSSTTKILRITPPWQYGVIAFVSMASALFGISLAILIADQTILFLSKKKTN